MPPLLIGITAFAVAVTTVMAAILVKMLRDERARSEARVAALTAMAAQGAGEAPRASRPRPPFSKEAAAPAADPRAAMADLELRPVEAVNVPTLFAAGGSASPRRQWLVIAGCLATLALAVGFVTAIGRTTAPAAPVAAPAGAVRTPLELLSLHHAQEAQRLVISGVVQNPRGGAPLSHVVATAFVFGPDGAFRSSSRAPLDFTTLAPGQESRFVVGVPIDGPVSRYRVGFRTEDGEVIEHVDRRAPDALAQK